MVDKPVAMVDERPTDAVEVDTMVDEPVAGAGDTTPGVGEPMAKVVAEVTIMIVEPPLVIVEAVCEVVDATPGVVEVKPMLVVEPQATVVGKELNKGLVVAVLREELFVVGPIMVTEPPATVVGTESKEGLIMVPLFKTRHLPMRQCGSWYKESQQQPWLKSANTSMTAVCRGQQSSPICVLFMTLDNIRLNKVLLRRWGRAPPLIASSAS